MKYLERRILILLLVLALTLTWGWPAAPAGAAEGITCLVTQEGGGIIITGETFPQSLVSLVVTRTIDDSKGFLDQTRSDGAGKYSFRLALDGGSYRTTVTCCGLYNQQELQVKSSDSKKVTVRVEGARETRLPRTEVEILAGDTTLLAAIKDALDDTVPYQMTQDGMIHTIDGEEGWQWLINGRGGMFLPTTVLYGGEEIVLIDDLVWNPVLTRLTAAQTSVKEGDSLTVTLEKQGGSPAAGQPVVFNSGIKTTDARGQVTFTAANRGTYAVTCEPSDAGLIRPEPLMVTVTEKSSGGTGDDQEAQVYVSIKGYQHTVVYQTLVSVGIFGLDPYLGPPDGSSASPSSGWGAGKFTRPTIAHALITALEEAGFTKGDGRGHYDFQDYGWSVYMAMVDGDREMDHTSSSGWLIKLNGAFIGAGPQAYSVQDGDRIEMYFSLNGYSEISGDPGVAAPGSGMIKEEDLEKILRETGKALINLTDLAEAKAVLASQTIQKINSDNPLFMENNGVVVEFPDKSLLTEEFTTLTGKAGSQVELGITELTSEEKEKILARLPAGENTGLFDIGGRIFDFTAEVVSGADGETRNKLTIFKEPLKVTLDLQDMELQPEDLDQLCAVRYVIGEDGRVSMVKLGGTYAEETGLFTFYTDSLSYYGIVKAPGLVQISLVINQQTVKVNGQDYYLDMPAVLRDDRTMVPLRFVGENLGAKVEWVEGPCAVVIEKDDKILELPIDRTIPGLDVPPTIENGRTLVPIRFVAEALEAYVIWLPREQQVNIIK